MLKSFSKICAAATLLLACQLASAADNAAFLERLRSISGVPPELLMAQVDGEAAGTTHHRRWRDLLLNSPEQLGQISFQAGRLVAGEAQSIKVIYRAGASLTQGARLALVAPANSGIQWQNTSRGKPNYASIRGPSGTEFKAVGILLAPPLVSWYEGAVVLGFELDAGTLQSGDTIDFNLNNLQIPTRAGELNLAVRFAQANNPSFIGPASGALTVHPAGVEMVSVSAPSRAGKNQPVRAKVTLQDRYGNVSLDGGADLDLIVDGAFQRRLQVQAPGTTIDGLSFSEPGLHFIEVRSGGGGLTGVSNPIYVQSGNRQVHWLDLVPNQQRVAGSAENDLGLHLVPRSLNQGGSYVEWLNGGLSLQAAAPFIPHDERVVPVELMKHVQIVSGDSQFEWFANRHFGAGYRLSVVGSSFTPLSPVGASSRSGITAIAAADIESGLQKQTTYATTGAKIIVHSTVNGKLPGQRAPLSQTRKIDGWVQGAGPLDRIELIKNGQVVATRRLAADPSAKVLKVSVRSSSAPFKGQRDLPRNGREWIGFVRSESVGVSIHSTPGFHNNQRQAVAQNGDQRVDFITWTHGGWSSFLLELTNVDEADAVEFSLKSGHEDRDIRPRLRPSSAIPGTRQLVPVFDLIQGPVVRQMDVKGYADELRLELIDPQSPSFTEFSFTDASPYSEEDYYYLKVTQVDDHTAWTSPVFVGGFDAQ